MKKSTWEFNLQTNEYNPPMLRVKLGHLRNDQLSEVLKLVSPECTIHVNIYPFHRIHMVYLLC